VALQIAVLTLLVALMFGAGLEVDRDSFSRLWKKTGLLTRVVVANLILVPLAAWFFTRIFRVTDPLAAGLILMAIAPGSPFLLLRSTRAAGNREFAVAFAALLPAISALTIPVTAQLLLPGRERAGVPASHLVAFALLQLVPLAFGMLVRYVNPASSVKLSRIVIGWQTVAAAVTLALLAPRMVASAIAVFGSYTAVAALCTFTLAFGIGWTFGGPALADRVTSAMATMIRNVTMALAIADDLADPLVSTSVVVCFLVQVVLTVGFRTVIAVRLRQRAEIG
jgi:bile acid:Na+ symporter, BASS family